MAEPDGIEPPSNPVCIRPNYPFAGRCTIYYTPPSRFIARSLEVPMTPFFSAVNNLADRLAQPEPPAVPTPPKSIFKKPAAAAAS